MAMTRINYCRTRFLFYVSDHLQCSHPTSQFNNVKLALLHEFTVHNKTVQYIQYKIMMSCAFFICTIPELH